ncbi:MAG: hypothetical protein H7326_08630, partial [Bdellovibrionaceae bacterium]|nr:hypothetical protein [Pseudobdellovibrionaceae bacterium]
MKNIILTLTTAFIFSACAPGSDSAKTAPVPVTGMPMMTGKDITNRSLCKGATPEGASVYVRGWEASHVKDDGMEVTTKIYFYAETMSLFSFCKKGGAETYATVTADAVVANGLVNVTRGDSKTIPETKNGISISCEATLKAPATWTYTFEGPCLRLNDNVGTLV